MATGPTQNEPQSLGTHLRILRENSGLTQDALARELFVTRQAVSGWERGRSEPDIPSLQKLARIYGTTVDGLLENVQTRCSFETLKAAVAIFMFAGFAITGILAWGAMIRRTGYLPLIICVTCCMGINLLIWCAMSGAIKSGNIRMIAGFDPDLHYHPTTLKRLLDAERFWIILSTTVACIPFTFTLVWPLITGFLFIILVCISHLIGVLGGIVYINRHFSDRLLPDPRDSWAKRMSSLPVYIFVAGTCFALIATAIGVDIFGIENNTVQAILFTFLLLLDFIFLSVGLMAENGRPKKAAMAGEPYKMRRSAIATSLLSFIVDILIIVTCAAG